MEPVGFAVGIVSLVGLFSSCLEAVEIFENYRSFANDSQVMEVQFHTQKVRLEQWGRYVGLKKDALSPNHHPALDDTETATAVKNSLVVIEDICQNFIGLHRPEHTSTESSASKVHNRGPRPTYSRRKKIAWAVRGKEHHKEQIALLSELVQQLHHLIPGATSINSTKPHLSDHDLTAKTEDLLFRIDHHNHGIE